MKQATDVTDVLIVEDSRVIREVVTSMSSTIGFRRVDSASTGEEALAMLKQHHYDLILSDWKMSPMSGSDLLKAVRADKQFADIKFLIMTTNLTVSAAETAKANGADGYIQKPFTIAALTESVARLHT